MNSLVSYLFWMKSLSSDKIPYPIIPIKRDLLLYCDPGEIRPQVQTSVLNDPVAHESNNPKDSGGGFWQMPQSR